MNINPQGTGFLEGTNSSQSVRAEALTATLFSIQYILATDQIVVIVGTFERLKDMKSSVTAQQRDDGIGLV